MVYLVWVHLGVICVVSVHVWRQVLKKSSRNVHGIFKSWIHCNWIYCNGNNPRNKTNLLLSVLTQEHSLPVPRWLTAEGFVALLGISLSLPSSHPLSLGCTDFFLPNQVRFSSKPFLTVMFPSAFWVLFWLFQTNVNEVELPYFVVLTVQHMKTGFLSSSPSNQASQ